MSFSRGAISPLLSIWRRARPLVAVLLLSACSSKSGPPPFTASGYVADNGAVRIWRKDDGDAAHILMAFSPWRGSDTTTGEYRWQDGKLTFLELNIAGKTPEHIKVRFDDRGELSFMQREINGQKQQLSNDQIALYQYRASQIKQTSDALRSGRVVLRQGRWQGNGKILTCEGQTVSTALDDYAVALINRRQSHSSLAVSVAWLEADKGSQLLLVANSDFCNWQPKPDTF